MIIHTDTKEKLRIFLNFFLSQIIIFSLFISILLYYFLFQDSTEKGHIIWLTSDYNFASLFVFYGIIAILNKLSTTISRKSVLVYNSILLILAGTIFLSGSRRAIFSMGALLSFLIVIQLVTLFRRNELLTKISSISRTFLFFIISIVILFFLYLYYTPDSFKNKTTYILGSSNSDLFRKKIAFILYRYSNIVNRNNTYTDIYNEIWDKNFIFSLDPENGWGKNIHKTVFPLEGKNVSIVPFAAKGYMIDSSCNVRIVDSKHISKTIIYSGQVDEDEYFQTSVFCYVSKDFNGDSSHETRAG
jgi:hypothetical protein